jgi:hypothetical protein
LLRWVTQMQGSEIELGGFKGRTNKLVDGCYSWWVGGCAVLTEALIGSGSAKHATSEQRGPEDDDNRDDVDGKCGSRYEKNHSFDIYDTRLAVQPPCPPRVCVICHSALRRRIG